MRTLPIAFVAFLVSGFAVAQESKPADPVRATIGKAIEWIASQAVPVAGDPEAVMFRESGESTDDPTAGIYGGTAGVLIFLENAAAVLNDERARKLADKTAKGLLASKRQDPGGGATWSKGTKTFPAGFYVGDAGVGEAFLIRSRIRKDDASRAVAVAVAEAIIARGKREGDGMYWPAKGVDIILGEAGTLLFLLDVGKETGDKRFLDAAVAAGRWLVSKAVVEPAGAESRERRLLWKCPMAGNRHLPNFSHGTAGVAYALARVGAATGDATCAQAAKDGAAWMMDHAICKDDGCRWAHTEGAKNCMAGWCHGPPGTARLFLLMHDLTGEQHYLDTAIASARWVMTSAGASPPPGLNPTLCCGVAGILDFFCDLYRVTGKEEFAEFAGKAGDYLVRGAKPDGEGVKWRNGSSSHEDKAGQHGLDFMLGASGEAFALLRLTTLKEKPDPVRSLPDRVVSVK